MFSARLGSGNLEEENNGEKHTEHKEEEEVNSDIYLFISPTELTKKWWIRNEGKKTSVEEDCRWSEIK